MVHTETLHCPSKAEFLPQPVLLVSSFTTGLFCTAPAQAQPLWDPGAATCDWVWSPAFPSVPSTSHWGCWLQGSPAFRPADSDSACFLFSLSQGSIPSRNVHPHSMSGSASETPAVRDTVTAILKERNFISVPLGKGTQIQMMSLCFPQNKT